MKLYDVIISGGGPVGLFLACELALAKCSVLVLEKAEVADSPLKRLPFGRRGLSAPSVEALERRGLRAELQVIQEPLNIPNRQAGHFAGIGFSQGEIDPSQWTYRLPGSSETHLQVETQELERALAARAQTLGVEIRRGLATSSFQQSQERVRVEAGSQTFEAKWLVGCDGSRSSVRKSGNFEFAGTEPEFTGYSALVELADPEKLAPGRNPTATGMYFQSQRGYLLMLEFDEGAGHKAEVPSLEQYQQVLRRVTNTDVSVRALGTVTTWTDRCRQATKYRDGKVLLAGDAAHIHSPLGGQGLNLGLGDALNLGWKLAAVVHGRAPSELLDTYDQERHPVGAQILDWSRAQVAIMRPGPHARALNAIIRELMDTRDGATYMAGRVWGIHTHYPLPGRHPLVGRSVPNFQLAGGPLAQRMHDGQPILLDFGSHPDLEALAGQHGLKYLAGPAQDQLGLTALFIRPDGIIAWTSTAQPDVAPLRQALNFVRLQRSHSSLSRGRQECAKGIRLGSSRRKFQRIQKYLQCD